MKPMIAIASAFVMLSTPLFAGEPAMLDYFYPGEAKTVILKHEKGGISQTFRFQFDKKTNQFNRIAEYSGAGSMPSVTEVFEIKNGKITKIANLGAVQKTDLQEPVAQLPVKVGDMIEGKYKVEAVDGSLKSASTTLAPCIIAVGGKFKTKKYFCRGWGLVREWSDNLPDSMSKGFSIQ